MNTYYQVKKVLKNVENDQKSRFKQTKDYVQHGNTSVKKHCIQVATVSCKIAQKLKLNVDKKSLIRGALLHDYFLYDWHTKREGHNIHGFTHPYAALRNAKKDFKLTPIEKDVIVRHMFPLTPIPPKYKEAWIVCMADKYCSFKETLYTVKKKAIALFGGALLARR